MDKTSAMRLLIIQFRLVPMEQLIALIATLLQPVQQSSLAGLIQILYQEKIKKKEIW